MVLLPPGQWPARLRRPYMYLDRTYSDLVRKCVESGLQRLARRGQVWQHGGSPLVNGAFAVVKDLAEDRFISALVQTNSLLNAEALPHPFLPTRRA